MDANMECPCCSGNTYGECCSLLIDGGGVAAAPVAVMRSRFTAHVLHNMAYIKKTMAGKALKLFDEETTADEWFDKCKWTKLEIVDAQDNIVEFKAHYTLDGQDRVLHERSKFQLFDNKWYFVSGQNVVPIIETSNKVGRNDPCICGSGKKYKKCCS